MTELEKCPVCNNIPTLQQLDTHWWAIYCSKYACDFPLMINCNYKKDAIDNWNKKCKFICSINEKEEL